DRALAELSVDLSESRLEGLLAVLGSCHVTPFSSVRAAVAAPTGSGLEVPRVTVCPTTDTRRPASTHLWNTGRRRTHTSRVLVHSFDRDARHTGVSRARP